MLAPLGLEDIGRLIADALHCPPERARPLARLVHEKTGGNPFFAIQFLTALAEEGLLASTTAVALPGTGTSTASAPRAYTDNVVDLMPAKLSRLPRADPGSAGAARLPGQCRTRRPC